MGIVDPIAMTNAMATGGISFDGTAAALTLIGLLVGSAVGLLFATAGTWRPGLDRLPRLGHVGPSPVPLVK